MEPDVALLKLMKRYVKPDWTYLNLNKPDGTLSNIPETLFQTSLNLMYLYQISWKPYIKSN